MLKLLKYEWKACARACLPIYGAVILVALINRLFAMVGISNVLGGMPEILAAMAYFGVMVAVFVVTLVILVQRFYKSLLGDEGYLMFTLPVTVSQHIWAKCIIAFVMSVLSGVAAFISMLILVTEQIQLTGIMEFFGDLFRVVAEYPESILYSLELLLLMVIGGFCGILFVYLCIALGHLAKKHRVAMAVVWYFVLSTVLQFLFGMMVMTADGGVFGAVFQWVNAMPEMVAAHVAMLLLCIGAAIPTAAFFLGTRYVLKNRLNLE